MITQWDLSILDWIQSTLKCGFLDAVMPVITLFGEGGIFWMALTVLLLIIPKTRKFGLAMFFALALDVVLCNMAIKPLVARPRPWTWRPGMEEIIQRLAPLPDDWSFPSGHTAVAFAGAGALLFSKTKWGWAALALAVLIGLSRLYLYIHFPTDVICGAVLGLLCGLAGAILSKSACKFYENRKK